MKNFGQNILTGQNESWIEKTESERERGERERENNGGEVNVLWLLMIEKIHIEIFEVFFGLVLFSLIMVIF